MTAFTATVTAIIRHYVYVISHKAHSHAVEHVLDVMDTLSQYAGHEAAALAAFATITLSAYASAFFASNDLHSV
jgi:hypothetical protein